MQARGRLGILPGLISSPGFNGIGIFPATALAGWRPLPLAPRVPVRERSIAMATSLTPRRSNGLTPLFGRDPWSMLQSEMNQLRSRFFGDEESWPAGGNPPSVDVSETENAVEVRMDVPGVKAKDIDIQLNGNLLTVTAHREEEKEEKGRTYHRVERQAGRYSRTITLPAPVVESEVAAEYHDGVLSVTLPKTDESKAHKIKVKG
jgi:HSP20 family protein